MVPQMSPHPGARPTANNFAEGVTVDTPTIRPRDEKVATTPEEKHLAILEERLAHELMDDEERQELRDRILRLRRRLGR